MFLEKVQKMSESTNIPILCIPNNDFICAKTNQILYIGILVNKQNKIHVHPNNIRVFLNMIYKLIMFSEKQQFLGIWPSAKNLTRKSMGFLNDKNVIT